MRKSSKVFCLLFAVLMLFTLSVTAFAGNETNDGNIKIEVATNKGSYGATGVAEITATITNVSGEDINNVTAQAVFNDLAPAGKRTSETSKSVDILKSGESFSFTYKATLNKDQHKLNIFQKIILWFVRLFNGGYNANNNNIDVVTECITEIEFGKFTAENVVQVGYEYNDNNSDDSDDDITSNPTYEELIENVDIDESYDYDESDISIDTETGLTYINNIIIIMFDDECTEAEKAEAINSINGKVVGGREITDTLYVEVSKSSIEDLEIMCEELSANYKLDAFFDSTVYVDSKDISYIPNDQFIIDGDNDFNIGDLSWSDTKFGTYTHRNWYHLAIKSLDAWKYNNFFNNINIGIVDAGFDTSHRDVSIQVISKDKNAHNHGTHVAGIIGATANNNIGSVGVVWNKNLYGYSIGTGMLNNIDNNYFRSDIFNGLETLVKNGCKVINLSLGYSQLRLSNSNDVYIDTKINIWGWGKEASKVIAKLHKKGYDFVVVQSAGNGAQDNKGVDAKFNGLFCSITEENCYSNKNVSVNEIMDRVIIVANATASPSSEKVNYQLSQDSNGGSQVDIAAPGTSIYSTIAGIAENYDDGTVKYTSGQKYGLMSGTSMAAPIVAGVAGLVWSVNKDFTGAEVKEIVIETAKKGNIWVKDNPDSPTTGDFPLVNAKLAVEEAIYRTYETGYVQGLILEETTEKPIEGAIVSFVSNNEKESITTMTTDENGNYDYQLPIGSYTVSVSHEKYYSTEIQTIEVLQDKHCIVNPLYMEKASRVFGTVTDITTQERISGVKVEVIDNASGNFEPFATTTTDQYGDYSLLLPYGSYSLSFNHNDYEYYGVALNIEDESYIKDIALSPESGTGDDDRPITASGECGASGDNVTWTLYEDGELVISGSGAMKDYRWLDNVPWYSNRELITRVIIGEQITKIGYYAFGLCYNLKSVNIPESVKEIDTYAFSGCKNLTDVILPESLSLIKARAFNDCDKLVEINIPRETTLEKFVFVGCDSLKSINVNENNASLSSLDGVLFDKNQITLIQYPANNENESYTIPKTVTKIQARAFEYCKNLKSIIITDNVQEIEEFNFEACTELTNVTIGKGISDIYDSVFNNCHNVKNIFYLGTIKDWCNINFESHPFDSYKSGGNLYVGGQLVEDLIIPDGISKINEFAFQRCFSLKTITLTNDVTEIEDYAFRDCNSVKEILWPVSVKKVGVDAFVNDNYDTLTINYMGQSDDWCDISFSYGILANGNADLYINGELVEKVILKDAVEIKDYCFYAYAHLKEVFISSSVEKISSTAFADTYNLESISVDEENNYYSSLNGVLFNEEKTDLIIYPENKSDISVYSVPVGVINIVESAFRSNIYLEEVIIANTVKTIGKEAFNCCTYLTKINIPDSVTIIESRAFDNCFRLNNVTIPANVESIGEDAFNHLIESNDGYIKILSPNCLIFQSNDTIYYDTIYGYSGSTAQEYAEKYGKTFIALD